MGWTSSSIDELVDSQPAAPKTFLRDVDAD
jgi:hypothetical protein